MNDLADRTDDVVPHLGLWDAVSIIVGIVVGTTIFKAPPTVFGGVSGPWQGLGCWALGGLLVLVGSLCYAELATTYPRMGGDYVYLTRAFGSWAGFLFGWSQLSVILAGSIGAMAYAFSDYAVALFDLKQGWSGWPVTLALAAVIVLTGFNLFGVMFGKTLQNVLTVAKALGMVVIVIAGFGWGGDAPLTAAEPKQYLGFGLSMVLVLYAYGGWSDAAFVAAEVRNRQRNIPIALLLGTSGIMLVYLVVNWAYLYGLGFEGVRESTAPAAAVLEQAWGTWGAKGISLLVMLSALGAINGLIFTGARIHVSLGKDHRLFAWLGHWNSVRGTPPRALLAQSAIALLLVVLVGTDAGRTQMDVLLRWLGFEPLPGEQTLGGFETLVAGTSPVFWAFFLMTGIAMFVLRAKDPDIERPFRAPFYPLEPLVFCSTSLYMLYSSLTYARGLSILGLAPLVIGGPLYALSRRIAPLEELTAPES